MGSNDGFRRAPIDYSAWLNPVISVHEAWGEREAESSRPRSTSAHAHVGELPLGVIDAVQSSTSGTSNLDAWKFGRGEERRDAPWIAGLARRPRELLVFVATCMPC